MKKITLLLGLAVLFVSIASEAQENTFDRSLSASNIITPISKHQFKISSVFSFYECTEPVTDPPCCAPTIDEIKKYCKCTKWELKVIPIDRKVTLEQEAYMYGETAYISNEFNLVSSSTKDVWMTSPTTRELASIQSEKTNDIIKTPRANFFLNDMAKQMFGVELPKTEAGFPVTVSEINRNYEKYEWVNLSKDLPNVGALAVWNGIGGIVLEGTGEIEVLYPSHRLKGQLTIKKASDINKQTPPKFLVPKSFLERIVNASKEESVNTGLN